MKQTFFLFAFVHGSICHLNTITGNDPISLSPVRKFTMHTLKRKFPFSSALLGNTSPPACKRFSKDRHNDLLYASSYSENKLFQIN